MFDYDLVMLALPIALVADHGRRHALPPGVKAALALGFVTPIVFTPIAGAVHLQLIPAAILVVFVAVWQALRASEVPVPQRGPAAGAVCASAEQQPGTAD